MVDVFSEVDEELRREKLTKLWKKFGPYIIISAILFVAGIALNVWWQDHVRSARMNESEQYQQALYLMDGGNEDKALEAFDQIIATSEYGYGLLARLQKASLLAKQGKVREAVSEYDAIAVDGALTDRFRDFASLQAAMILMDTGSGAEAAGRLEALTQSGGPWHYLASEQLGLWRFKNQEYDMARTIFQSLVLDAQAPQDLRGRAEEILEMVENTDPQNLLGNDTAAVNDTDKVSENE